MTNTAAVPSPRLVSIAHSVAYGQLLGALVGLVLFIPFGPLPFLGIVGGGILGFVVGLEGADATARVGRKRAGAWGCIVLGLALNGTLALYAIVFMVPTTISGFDGTRCPLSDTRFGVLEQTTATIAPPQLTCIFQTGRAGLVAWPHFVVIATLAIVAAMALIAGLTRIGRDAHVNRPFVGVITLWSVGLGAMAAASVAQALALPSP